MHAIQRSATLGLALLGSACSIAPVYQAPDAQLPAQFEAVTIPDASAASTQLAQWWMLFNQPELDALIEAALTHNPDITLAAARIEEARAQAAVVDASLLPTLNGNAQGKRSRSTDYNNMPTGPNPSNRFNLGLTTQYEIDFWGKRQQQLDRAHGNLQIATLDAQTVELSLTSLVAQAYFNLRALDEQIALTQNTIESYQQTVQLTQRRAKGGIASTLDVNLAETIRAQAATDLFQLQQQRALTEHQLALLTGQPEQTMQVKGIHALTLPPIPPAGLPSELLQRRPDIQQAEQQLRVAHANLAIAKTALYPSIALSGSLGHESAELSNLLKNGAQFWSFGLALNLPLFDNGERQALVAASTAQQKQVLAQYQKTVQQAFKEVSDALSTLRYRYAAQTAFEQRLNAARAAHQLAQQRYESGYSSYLELLESQRTLNATESAFIAQHQAKLQAIVALCKALGGDW